MKTNQPSPQVRHLLETFFRCMRPPARPEFDTFASVTMPDFEQLAARYRTSARTVRRWHAAGVDVADPLAVAIHVASIQHPAPAALDACQEILTHELNEAPRH